MISTIVDPVPKHFARPELHSRSIPGGGVRRNQWPEVVITTGSGSTLGSASEPSSGPKHARAIVGYFFPKHSRVLPARVPASKLVAREPEALAIFRECFRGFEASRHHLFSGCSSVACRKQYIAWFTLPVSAHRQLYILGRESPANVPASWGCAHAQPW